MYWARSPPPLFVPPLLSLSSASVLPAYLPVLLPAILDPQVWKQSSFAQRRLLMEVLLKYILDHQDTICQ